MARASSTLTRATLATANWRCASGIPAWDCRSSRPSRSSMRSSRRSAAAPVLACRSATPSSSRTMGADGPTTMRRAGPASTCRCRHQKPRAVVIRPMFAVSELLTLADSRQTASAVCRSRHGSLPAVRSRADCGPRSERDPEIQIAHPLLSIRPRHHRGNRPYDFVLSEDSSLGPSVKKVAN